MPPPLDAGIATTRLRLRPFRISDAERVVEIQSDRMVGRMLRAAAWPPDLAETRAWLAGHAAERAAGTAWRFAVILAGSLIGCADVDEIADGSGSLGYWLVREAWGQGLATEAATVVVHFAFETLDLTEIHSGCAADNPASAKVLTRLGFTFVDEIDLWSRGRGAMIQHRRYKLARSSRSRTPG